MKRRTARSAGRHSDTAPGWQDRPHPATEHDAGTGQGTVSDPHYNQRTLDHPVLDGSTESSRAQAATVNPYRGYMDPERRHPRKSDRP